MKAQSRPLSPHLQIYKPQLTSAMSIFHRITGVANVVGTPLVLWWIGSAAHGREAYEAAAGFFGSWFGMLLLFAWSISLFYHLSNGIRHLIWDSGKLLEIEQAYKAGYAVLASTAILTVLAWIVGLSI